MHVCMSMCVCVRRYIFCICVYKQELYGILTLILYRFLQNNDCIRDSVKVFPKCLSEMFDVFHVCENIRILICICEVLDLKYTLPRIVTISFSQRHEKKQ